MSADLARFKGALLLFLEGCNAIRDKHKCTGHVWADNLDTAAKYVRIRDAGGAWCFVELATGDVLKCASWAKPAKHARGNIYAADKGLGTIGPYGPAYLR